MEHITDIFFDLDHTLWDFDKNSEISYKLIFDKLDINIEMRDFLGVYKQINIDLWKLFREDAIDKDTLRYRRLHDSFKAINVSPKIKYIEIPENIKHQYQYYTKANMDKIRKKGYKIKALSLEKGVHDYVTNYLLSNDQYK